MPCFLPCYRMWRDAFNRLTTQSPNGDNVGTRIFFMTWVCVLAIKRYFGFWLVLVPLDHGLPHLFFGGVWTQFLPFAAAVHLTLPNNDDLSPHTMRTPRLVHSHHHMHDHHYHYCCVLLYYCCCRCCSCCCCNSVTVCAIALQQRSMYAVFTAASTTARKGQMHTN